ncbi:hypothetical protein ACIA8K_22880 [Catenuloplanes sp. NPDC051500]|uniref:hypothetical protein n=1 Tax=Catenuloplanes sp. NPDC051500 TaxID=3363959 RepID=UPI00378A55B5
MTPLRHRLAALTFPPGQRRDELIDTLAEAEQETGRRGPRPREALDILWHGARARLGRPKNPLVVPAAVLFVLLGAFAGAVVTTQLAWQAVPPLRGDARAAQISETVFPGLHVFGGGDAPDFVPEPGAESGLVNGYIKYSVKHTDATRNIEDYQTGAQERLTAAGWAVHRITVSDDDGQVFWAERDGLVLQFSIWYWPDVPSYDSDGGAFYRLSRATPDWMWAAALPGVPVGALAAFLVFGWVSRRTVHATGGMAVIAVVSAFPLLLVCPAVVRGTQAWWRTDPLYPPTEPFWRPLFYDITAFATVLLMLLAVIAVAVAALQRPFPLPRLRGLLRRPPVWRAGLAAASVAHVAVAGLWLAGAVRPCDPDGVPEPLTGAQARTSTEARVYVSPAATDDQRNLIQAAIGRAGGGYSWHPQRAAHGPITLMGCGTAVPWFEIFYDSPGMAERLEHEVSGMPGVVAIRQTA